MIVEPGTAVDVAICFDIHSAPQFFPTGNTLHDLLRVVFLFPSCVINKIFLSANQGKMLNRKQQLWIQIGVAVVLCYLGISYFWMSRTEGMCKNIYC